MAQHRLRNGGRVDRRGVVFGPNGLVEKDTKSTNDFQVFDLFRIVEVLATEFDDLPALIPGRLAYRILIGVGVVVARFAVIGQLAGGRAVDLVQLDIDTESSW